MTLEFILLLITAYLLGSIHAGYLLPKWFYHIDIREHGTGKIGASNVMRVTSKWMAAPVMLCDIGKGMLAVWLAQLVGLGSAAQVTIGLAAIIGHNWPIFLNFNGGRGVFTSLGVITMISPLMGLIMLVGPYLFTPIKKLTIGVFLFLFSLPFLSWYFHEPLGIDDRLPITFLMGLILLFVTYIFAPVKQVAFGVFLFLFSLPFLSWFLYEPLGIDDRLPITLGFIALSLLAYIRRVITPRTPLSQSTPAVELFFNRLILDRDIRDAKAWVNQKSEDKN